MLILVILVFGLAVGWIAQLLLGRGGRNVDWGLALVSGLAGSLLGGLVASLIAGDGLRLRPSGIIGSIAGAVVIVAIVGAVRGRSRA